MKRRAFIKVVASGTLAAGCCGVCRGSGSAARSISAGPVTDYEKDGIYDRFADQGAFIIRKGNRLFALSSVCPHKQCRVDAAPDRSFVCDCHGSEFSPEGKVTHGPADRDLPECHTRIEHGRLIIEVGSR